MQQQQQQHAMSSGEGSSGGGARKEISRPPSSSTMENNGKGKANAIQDSTGVFPSHNEERGINIGQSSSSTMSLTKAIQGTASQNIRPDPAQLNLEDVVASAAYSGPSAGESNVGATVALHNVRNSEPHGSPIVALNVGHIVAPHGAVPVQSNVALNVALPVVLPNVAPNVAPVASAPDAPVPVAPAPVAPAPVRRNVAPVDMAPVRLNGAPAGVAPAPPIVARAQPDAATIAALDVNRGLILSGLRPLRVSEAGSEGYLWPNLLRN